MSRIKLGQRYSSIQKRTGVNPQKFHGVVRDLASDGRGIVLHPSGLTVFVGGVWPGEEGLFRIIRSKNRWAEGDLLELTQASPQRVTPFCTHHGFADGQCGACPWQFIAYNAQLRAKQQRVTNELGKISACVVNDIIPSPVQQEYRVRAQLKTDGNQIGFVSANSNSLAPVKDCAVLSPTNRSTLKTLLQQLPQSQWRPQHKNRWITLDIDEDTGANAVSVNKRLPFQQSHQQQNLRMQQWLAQQSELIIKQHGCIDNALELFCGSGNFTRTLSDTKIVQIVAVDVAQEAIDTLNQRQLPGVTALARDLFADGALEKLLREQPLLLQAYSLLVLDPPREGCKNIADLFQGKKRFESILYISCDLATFCRDVTVCQQRGYQLQEVQPIDTAPHTPHIELLARLDYDEKH